MNSCVFSLLLLRECNPGTTALCILIRKPLRFFFYEISTEGNFFVSHHRECIWRKKDFQKGARPGCTARGHLLSRQSNSRQQHCHFDSEKHVADSSPVDNSVCIKTANIKARTYVLWCENGRWSAFVHAMLGNGKALAAQKSGLHATLK